MFCMRISWLICAFVAVTIATGRAVQDSKTESSVTERVQEVRPSPAVELGWLLDAWEGAAVTLVSGDTRLLAHRSVLAARSPVLQRLLQDAAIGEVAVPEVEGPALRALLAYLYTLQAPQLPAVAPQLLAAAHQYGLPALKAACERQLAAQMTVQNAAATAVLAVRHSGDSLKTAAIRYIRAHYLNVTATQGWADAIRSQPEVIIQVSQLLRQFPPETSSTAPADSEPSPHAATQPHVSHSSRQSPATAAPTVAAQTVPQTDDGRISRLRSLSPNEKDRRLIEAAKEGAVAELEALLASGADVGARGRGTWTALHWAARGGHEEAARRLLAAGAAVDARGSGQWTPLHFAARNGHADVVRLLLARNAYHSARNSGGWTPLHLAAYNGQTEAADALLAAGADRAARDNEGNTPLDMARRKNRQRVAQLLEGGTSVTATTSST